MCCRPVDCEHDALALHYPWIMAQYFRVHPENPQRRLLRQASDILQRGGVIVYPTDSTYALGCRVGERDALERIRSLRQLDEQHHFTLACRDLSEISLY